MVKELLFPKDFIWGAATSALQIEGARYEDGKSDSIWDQFCTKPGKILHGETNEIACDHYHRWQEDIRLMSQMGLKAYRFSIAWPRVLPEGRGKLNQAGADFYSRLVDGLLEKGIEPFATLYHWDLPQTLQDGGGWLNRRITDWFAEYAAEMYNLLGDRVTYWSTINEPNVFSYMGYESGEHAPGFQDQATSLQVLHHLLLAHGEAVRIGRQILPKAKFGIVPAISHLYPASDNDADREAVQKAWEYTTGWYMDLLLKGEINQPILRILEEQHVAPVILEGDSERIGVPIDFLGINHYASYHLAAGPDGMPQPVDIVARMTDRNWPIVPEGFRDMLQYVTKRYGKIPIYIMENGASYPDQVSADGQVHDSDRVEYLKDYISALHLAIENGVDVKGYFVWSLLDNFEFAFGYHSRFGLIHVDFQTQKRIVKDSGWFYNKVIQDNGIKQK